MGIWQTLQRLLSWTPCDTSIDEAVLCVAAAEAAEPAPIGTPYSPNYFTSATYFSSPMQCLRIQVQAKPPPTFERCDLAAISDPSLQLRLCGDNNTESWCNYCQFYGGDATTGGVYVTTAGRKVSRSHLILKKGLERYHFSEPIVVA